jgi:hypothetical protein
MIPTLVESPNVLVCESVIGFRRGACGVIVRGRNFLERLSLGLRISRDVMGHRQIPGSIGN